ncbi:MAG: HPP family protein [Methylococcaceae bacterium]|nr:HPP family protein [Methylococcaceae bacterium]
MRLFGFFSFLTIEPVKLSLKEKGIAALACLTAILLTGLLTRACAVEPASVLVASMGASAAILFAIPGSPLAQPWPFAGGQMSSALVGVMCAAYIDDVALAAGLAAGLAVLAMLALRCLHPPGAATALAPVLNGVHPSMPNLDFVLVPVGINVLLMLALAWLINRLVLRRDYPARLVASRPANDPGSSQGNLVGITQADIEQATHDFDHFLDIGADELQRIFTRLQLLSFQKRVGTMTCGEIMQRDIVTVEYATEVEVAWLLMHEHRLKVLPVLDRAGFVIGIVTRHDFLKNLKLTPYRGFQDKWLAFIKNTPDINTDKPEAIGHIMTRKVKTLPAGAHIAELIPLIVDEGHHHIPVVDDNGHFLGMVFQSRLLSALFNHCVFKDGAS